MLRLFLKILSLYFHIIRGKYTSRSYFTLLDFNRLDLLLHEVKKRKISDKLPIAVRPNRLINCCAVN